MNFICTMTLILTLASCSMLQTEESLGEAMENESKYPFFTKPLKKNMDKCTTYIKRGRIKIQPMSEIETSDFCECLSLHLAMKSDLLDIENLINEYGELEKEYNENSFVLMKKLSKQYESKFEEFEIFLNKSSQSKESALNFFNKYDKKIGTCTSIAIKS